MLILLIPLFYIVLLAVAIWAPLYIKLVVFAINFCMPDGLPFLEETIQIAFIVKALFFQSETTQREIE